MWSPQQDRALRAVARWRRSQDSQVFRLFGYVGTGKTTLAKHLGAEQGDGKVLFAAFTGKAALVLRKKGCAEASTIHSLIYRPVEVFVCPAHPDALTYREEYAKCRLCGSPVRPRPYPEFVRNEDSPLHAANLLVIDECSMVGEALGRDLLAFKKPILVLGDPYQLPPPNGAGYFTNDKPDVLLAEVHRQAAGNPIIRMSMEVRAGRHLASGRYGDSEIDELAKLRERAHDQMLVGRNVTRVHLNAAWRKQLGFVDPLPMIGDKLVCLRNDPDKGLLNGSLWTVGQVRKGTGGDLYLEVRPEDDSSGSIATVRTHQNFFVGDSATATATLPRASYFD
jgi:ATP-dependent exoDNAse (exonuclease V) alpha subunit